MTRKITEIFHVGSSRSVGEESSKGFSFGLFDTGVSSGLRSAACEERGRGGGGEKT